MAESRESGQELGTLLRTFLGILEKRKWFAIGMLIASIGTAVLLTEKQVPVYKASATLIIDRRSPAVLSRVQEVIELGTDSYWSMKDYMNTQYEVLKSRRLVKRVVDRLTLGLDEHFLEVDRIRPVPPEDARREIVSKMDPVAFLAGRVSVEPKPDSQVVVVSVEHSDPHLAEQLANALALEYKEENLEYKRRVISEAVTELRTMLVALRHDKDAAEQKLFEFERRHSTTSLDSRRKQVENRLNILTQGYLEAQGQRTSEETNRTREELVGQILELEEILSRGDCASSAHPVLVSSGAFGNLKLRLIEMETDVRELSGKYGPKHPVMQAALAQRSFVRAALQSESKRLLESELNTLRHTLEQENNKLRRAIEIEEELRAQLDEAREEEAALAKLELDYVPLKKNTEEAAKIYQQVKDRYSETSLTAQVETNNVRIQDLAVAPAAPIRPRKALNVLVGIVLGLLLGAGAAYLVESLDSTLKTREDVEGIGPGLGFLGIVPAVEEVMAKYADSQEGSGSELYVHSFPKSSLTEHFHTVRTNLTFLQKSVRPRRVLVTSPGPKEGKTTIAVNLAALGAMSGVRTLVIDTDMRRPRVHKVVGLTRRPGITEYFIGDRPIQEFCRRTVVPGLDVITCGAISPNPVEILESKKFKDMLEELGQTYGSIVFDSPPLLAVADSKILGAMVEAAVLVVRAGKTTKEALREARELLAPVLPEDVGVVLNGFDVEKHSYRYYYYRSKTYGYYNYYSYDEREGGDGAGRKEEADRSGRWARRSA